MINLAINLPKEAKDELWEFLKILMQVTQYATTYLEWKNQYCQNGHATQGNLQIQCNPYQNTKGVFQWTRKKIQLLTRS